MSSMFVILKQMDSADIEPHSQSMSHTIHDMLSSRTNRLGQVSGQGYEFL